MKLFRVVNEDAWYGDCASAIVACESEEKLQKLIDDGVFQFHYGWNCHNDKDFAIFDEGDKLSIEEIELDKIKDTEIILASYNEC